MNKEAAAHHQSRFGRIFSRLQGPVAVLALALVALRAVLGPSLPCADDAAFHLLRLTQLDHLLRQGVLYSRWAPDMAQGYGFPFFNFYAPLSYYAAALVSWPAQNLNLGLRLTFALGLLASGLAAYGLARDHFSQPASLVAAVAYMYAPYQAYDILFRGNLAESAAWPLLPLALWAMGRLARSRQPRWLIVTSLSYAAVLLTHNVFALILSPLLLLYGLSEAVLNNQQSEQLTDQQTNKPTTHASLFRLNPVLPVLLSLGLGLGLAAFFWLPALAERSLVHSDRLLVPPVFVYWGNFVTLAEIFAPPQPGHPDLINPSPARALGLVPLLLALPGLLLGGWRFRDSRRRQVLFFGAATAVTVFMMTAVSRPFWDALPLIEFIQFPWRLLGPAALTLALLCAATVDLFGDGRPYLPLAAALVATTALVLADLSWLEARYCPGLANPSVAEMQSFERATHTIGTTAKGEYLPRTVEFVPEQPAVRPFAPLPATARLLAATRESLHLQAQVSASRPFTLTANVFDYAGWQATVNGEPAPITPSSGTGLITLLVPAGQHQIDIRFGETPLRLAADALSLLSLIALAVLAVTRQHMSGTRAQGTSGKGPASTLTPSPPHPLTLSLFGLLLFAFVNFVLPGTETPLRRPGQAGMEETAAYANHLILLDTRIAARAIEADRSLPVSLRWTVRQPIEGDYQSTLRLIGPRGETWSAKNSTRPRRFRPPRETRFWQPNQYAEDNHLLTPLPGTPPGLYRIQLILFDADTLAPAPLADGSPALELGTVQILRPRRPFAPQPQYTAETTWDDVQLVGYNLDREEATPGDPFLLTLFWQADREPVSDYTARLSLVAADGSPALTLMLPPVRRDFPTSQWQAGDRWRGQHSFHLPVRLQSGRYRWTLTLCDDGCRETTADLGSLHVNAPERIFTPPELEIPLQAQFGSLATLLGATTTSPEDQLQVTLAWQVQAETDTGYHVFLHLIEDGDGRIVAQSDQEPARWTRPTTGWLPGEVVVDEHTLDLSAVPPGLYWLRAGLYDPTTRNRLTLPDGETAVPVTEFTIDE